MGADGSGARRLTDDGFADRMPAFSPDGARIAFVLRPRRADRGGPVDDRRRRIRPAPAAHRSRRRPLAAVLGRRPVRGPGDERLRRLRHRLRDRRRRAALRRDLDHRPQRARRDRAGDPARHGAGSPTPSPTRRTRARATSSPPTRTTAPTSSRSPSTPPAASARPPSRPTATEVVYVADGGLVIAAAGGLTPARCRSAGVRARRPGLGGRPAGRSHAAARRRSPRRRSRDEARDGAVSFQVERAGLELRLPARPAATFKPCESPRATSGLERGRHRFAVQATDAAGNTDPSPAPDRFH